LSSKLQTLDSELTTEEARFLIDELSYLNSVLLLVLSGGEPLLREDILDIVEYASQAGFITVLGSNGTLLTRETLKSLKEAGLRGVGISIDSTIPSNHDSFRGFNGAWELSINALRFAGDLGIETQMDVTLTDRNIHEIENFVELGASLSVKAVNFFFLVCTGRAMKTDITGYNYESTLKKITQLIKMEKRLMIRARCTPHIYRLLYEEGFKISQGTRGCLAGRHYMRIDPEGNVTPCPYMPFILGNIKKSSLTDIWENSTYLRQMREERYKGKCGVCEYVEICGGCRARALIEKRDFMEEDPLCSYEPKDGERISLSNDFKTELIWEDKAKERIKRVPVFMKKMVIRMIETKAREKGISLITSEFIDEVKYRGYPSIHKDYRDY
jgi:radical SAM protein with 4Fe4S-binding SPASM domain